MSGSHRYLGALESFCTMLSSYPTRAEPASIDVAMDPARQVTVTVHLAEAEPATLAAGLVDWERTLGQAEMWAWRTPNSREVHVAVVGFGTECDETPIAVVAGPVPYGKHLDHDLEPDLPEQLDTETLYTWLGAEITQTWPFDAPLERS